LMAARGISRHARHAIRQAGVGGGWPRLSRWAFARQGPHPAAPPEDGAARRAAARVRWALRPDEGASVGAEVVSGSPAASGPVSGTAIPLLQVCRCWP
jgi:hypothetical protein